MYKSVIIHGKSMSGKSMFINDLKKSLSGSVVLANIELINNFSAIISADNVIIEGCSCSSIEDVIELNRRIIFARPAQNNIFFIVGGDTLEISSAINEDFYTLQSSYSR